jgi:acetylornithine deacetylase/succinyl-diaminopimelate desuccinylase-like protein
VRGRAGDASLPGGGPNALLELTRLLERVEAYQAPVRVPAEVEQLIDTLAPGGSPHEERLEQAVSTHPAFERLLHSLVRDVIHPTIAESPGPKNIIPEQATATLSCTVLPNTTAEILEQELRDALGEGDYDLDVVEPKGGSISELDTPLHAAIAEYLAEHDPEARLVPALGYGFSDCHVFRESYGSVAYGFIPFRHGDSMLNLETKHGHDERILLEDLVFQTRAAIAVAQQIGSPTRGATR